MLVLFTQILTQMNVPGKKGSVSFYMFQLSTFVQKFRRN